MTTPKDLEEFQETLDALQNIVDDPSSSDSGITWALVSAEHNEGSTDELPALKDKPEEAEKKYLDKETALVQEMRAHFEGILKFGGDKLMMIAAALFMLGMLGLCSVGAIAEKLKRD